jgi:hypothetical protein
MRIGLGERSFAEPDHVTIAAGVTQLRPDAQPGSRAAR